MTQSRLQAVILAGGKGTRLGERARHTPKPLLTVAGRPFIEHLLFELRRHGVTEVILLVGPSAEPFERRLGGGERFGVRLIYVEEPSRAGTGGAIRYAGAYLDDRFLLMNGDSWFDVNLLRVTSPPLAEGIIGRIALRELADTARFGRVEIAEDGRVLSFTEKVDARPGYINGGIYWLDRSILDRLPEGNCSLEHDIFPALAAEGRLTGIALSGRFVDIGTPEDFERATRTVGSWSRRPAVFLDRDGVLNKDGGYVHRPDQIEWIDGSARAIARLNDAGYFVFVVTNQAGVARGYYDEETVQTLHRWINGRLAGSAAHVDAFYYCPHHPTEGEGAYLQACKCRKPAPGMLLQAMAEWPVDRTDSFLIGDKASDLEAADAAGLPSFLFPGGDLDRFVSACLSDLEAAS